MKVGTTILAGFTAASVGLVAVNSMMAQNIANTKHNFSGFGWAEGEICRPCHTPHNADTDLDFGPLWNHEQTAATYQVYKTGATLPGDEALDARSLLCMSCHDGTVAVDSYGGRTGTVFIGSIGEGRGLVGTDLSDDHPVGATGVYPTAQYMHQPPLNNLRLREMEIGGEPKNVVSCTTCHEAHGRYGNPYMLWTDNNESNLCQSCHKK